MSRLSRGFTLLELMLVVAIIGTLAAIAVPKFANLLRKSNEGQTRGNLGALRSAVTIYYADMEGQYPTNLASLSINGKYLSFIPKNVGVSAYHANSNSIESIMGTPEKVSGGGWWYPGAPNMGKDFGTVWVNCTHTDLKGSSWSDY
jgi:prepilin-type N-terminal cleavage/methylation domain-containing protein